MTNNNKNSKSSNTPATQGMLYELRKELKSDLTSLELKMRAGFEKVDLRLTSEVGSLRIEVKTDLEKINLSILSLKNDVQGALAELKQQRMEVREIQSLTTQQKVETEENRIRTLEQKAEIAEQTSRWHRILALWEEEKAQRKFLFDGLAHLMGQQNQLESRVQNIESRG